MNALKITAKGEVSQIEVSQPFYKSLQEVVGGYIEIVRPKGLPQPYCMIVDEEGLLKEKPPNIVGSVLYGTAEHGQPIVGDIAIMREENGNEGRDLFGLNAADTAKLAPIFEDMVTKYREYEKLRG